LDLVLEVPPARGQDSEETAQALFREEEEEVVVVVL